MPKRRIRESYPNGNGSETKKQHDAARKAMQSWSYGAHMLATNHTQTMQNALNEYGNFFKRARGDKLVVADLGCGPGNLSAYLINPILIERLKDTKVAITLFALDLSSDMIAQAERTFNSFKNSLFAPPLANLFEMRRIDRRQKLRKNHGVTVYLVNNDVLKAPDFIEPGSVNAILVSYGFMWFGGVTRQSNTERILAAKKRVADKIYRLLSDDAYFVSMEEKPTIDEISGAIPFVTQSPHMTPELEKMILEATTPVELEALYRLFTDVGFIHRSDFNREFIIPTVTSVEPGGDSSLNQPISIISTEERPPPPSHSLSVAVFEKSGNLPKPSRTPPPV